YRPGSARRPASRASRSRPHTGRVCAGHAPNPGLGRGTKRGMSRGRVVGMRISDEQLLEAKRAGATYRQLDAAGHGSRSQLQRRIKKAEEAERQARAARRADYDARRRSPRIPPPDPAASDPAARPELSDPGPAPPPP